MKKMLKRGVHYRHAFLQMRLTRESIHVPIQENIKSAASILMKDKIMNKEKNLPVLTLS